MKSHNYGCACALQNNMPLFDLLAFHKKQYFLSLYEIYTAVDVSIRLGVWALSLASTVGMSKIGKILTLILLSNQLQLWCNRTSQR
jgi:hypothetical protein